MIKPIRILRDDDADTLTLDNITYSQELFRQLGGLMPVGQPFRLVARSIGIYGNTLFIEAIQPQGETPNEDKSHPRFIAGYTAGLHDHKLGQPQGEQVACMPVERCYDVRAKMIIAFNEAKKDGGDLDDALDAAYKSALRYSPNPMNADQPAPVAVVVPDILSGLEYAWKHFDGLSTSQLITLRSMINKAKETQGIEADANGKACDV